jgi:N-methylhydantoinase A
LIATEGFRDVIEIGSEGRFDQYDLQIEKQIPLVPRALRLTVPERVDARGQTILAMDEDAFGRHVSLMRRENVESIAICFLHSYVNGDHERRAREILACALPDIPISISCEVCPEIREYERTSTTVANAYVRPQMADYLARMDAALECVGFCGAIYLVTSNGGLTSLETARRFPVRLIESGPAGGAIFAADVAARLEERRVLSFDMGGTTAKLCLIEDFSADTDRVYEVDRAARFQKGSGLPLRIPVIDLVEIGAGGGSIAHVNVLKNVMVGPRSAGSEPGPACYGLGGDLPTVTDADAVLGLIDPASFAGGAVRLDVGLASAVLSTHIGDPLQMSAEMAAYAVHEMVCESMASAARVHAIEKGRTTSNHTMIAFGGAAPLHAARVAEKIGVGRVVIPRNAGVGSAVGFLRAPISYELVRSRHAHLDSLEYESISEMLLQMENEARDLIIEGASGAALVVRRLAFMRYVGQGHEIAVVIPSSTLGVNDRNNLNCAFEELYTRLFNRIIPGAPKEILSWSVLVSTEKGAATSVIPGPSVETPQTPMAWRPLFEGRQNKAISVPVFERESLPTGARIVGPALISERETTTFVSSTFNARIDGEGNILMERKLPFGGSHVAN